MVDKIHHIGIAVKNIDNAIKLYTDVFGIKPDDIERETVGEQNVKAAMIPIGETCIELLEGTGAESSIAKFIEKRGEGLHHMAFGVKDIDKELKALKAKGMPLIDSEARIGFGGERVAFLHPKGTTVLIEIVEL